MKIMMLAIMLAMLMTTGLKAETVNLNDANTVFLKDVVMDGSITKVVGELSKRESNTEPVIYLVLDTPGGSVFAGLNLISYLKGYKKPVKTITVFAASMGFQIAQGNPNDRLISDTGVLMSHPMSGGMGGEIGNGLSLDNRIGYIKEIVKTMDEQVVARTKGKTTLEKYQKAYDNELWTTGKFAIEKGYADSVVSLNCAPELTEGVESVNTREWVGGVLAMEIEYETSKCPVMTAVLRYQIRLVHLPTGQKIILFNNGYDISNNEESSQPSQSTSTKGKRAAGDSRNLSPINNLVISQEEIKTITDKSESLKNFQFFLKRDMDSVKNISWL